MMGILKKKYIVFFEYIIKGFNLIRGGEGGRWLIMVWIEIWIMSGN